MKYQLGVNLVRLLLAWLSLVARDSKLVVVVLEAIGCVDCHLGLDPEHCAHVCSLSGMGPLGASECGVIRIGRYIHTASLM